MAYVLAMAWPVLSIIFIFSLIGYFTLHRQSPVDQLALMFGYIGFAIVAGMISIQLAADIGTQDFLANSPDRSDQLHLIHRSLRLIDMGLDVAWDIFIGTSLIFLSIALYKQPRFGFWWGIPCGLLGCLLIILNVATFPWPPSSRGLFDIGPAIGLFIIALSVRLITLGIELKRGPA